MFDEMACHAPTREEDVSKGLKRDLSYALAWLYIIVVPIAWIAFQGYAISQGALP